MPTSRDPSSSTRCRRRGRRSRGLPHLSRRVDQRARSRPARRQAGGRRRRSCTRSNFRIELARGRVFEMRPSFSPSSASHACSTAAWRTCCLAGVRRAASFCSTCAMLTACADRPDQSSAGRAGDDAVEVAGEHLRFLERLTSARRAAVPVRVFRRAAVERVDDGLGLERSSRARSGTRSRSAFSGWPSAKLALPPACPVSVELVA